MNINSSKNDACLKIALEGRLDTTTAPDLENFLKDNLNDVTAIEFDLAALEYVSSAGLRVFLATQKFMSTKGTMKFKNVCDNIIEVFEVTGFADIFEIE